MQARGPSEGGDETDRGPAEFSDSEAAEHRELRRIATRLMADEQPGHTLRPTALAHEAWLRLRTSRNARTTDQRSLLALAAWSMRRILIDHARRRVRRGRRTTWTGKVPPQVPTTTEVDDATLLRIDAALRGLADLDAQLARIVELRFFAGATVEETAAAMDVSARTVKRRWAFARAWLHDALRDSEGEE